VPPDSVSSFVVASNDTVPVWSNPEPRSENDFWMMAQNKIAAGVPMEQVWREAGYTEQQIAEFQNLNAEAQVMTASNYQTAFNAGRIG